jgi:MFS family permease
LSLKRCKIGVILRKHHGELDFTNIAKLGIVGLLVAFSSSFVVTIWAIYLDSFVNNISTVGFISAFLTLIGIASYFISIPFIERTSKSKIFSHVLIIFVLAYIVLFFTKSLWMFILVATILTISGTLRLTSFGLMIKDKSKKEKLSRNEGLLFTFTNIAFVIGPLLAGFISSKFGVKYIFLIASLFLIFAFFILRIGKVKDNRKDKKVHNNILKNFKAFFNNKDRLLAYVLGGGVGFWWILSYLYVPLYIIRSGLDTIWVGYFLFALPIPLILFEYKFASSVKKHGYKRLFKIGFLIPAIASLICFFFIDQIFVVLGILVFSSIGLAMLEPTVEAYFFRISSKKDEQRFYGPYNTRIEVFGFIGKVLPAALLLFLPFEYIFLFFSGVMFLLVLISFKTKNIKG